MTMYRIETSWEDEKGMIVKGEIVEEADGFTKVIGTWITGRNLLVEGNAMIREVKKYKKLTTYQEARALAAFYKRHPNLRRI